MAPRPGWLLALLFPVLCAAQEQSLDQIQNTGPAPSALMQKAAKEFQAGDMEAACADATQAAANEPKNVNAAGMKKLACDKARTTLHFKGGMEIRRHTERGGDPQPAPGGAPGAQPQMPPAEQEEQYRGPNIAPPPQDVGSAPVAIPATPLATVKEEVTTYGKTMEAQDLINRGHFPEAAAAAALAVQLDSRNVRAHVILAAAYHDGGEPEKCLAAAEEGLKVAPQNLALLKNKTAAQIKLKDYKSAIATADYAILNNATDPTAHALRAYALGLSGDRDGMFNALKTASALDPGYERLLVEAQASAADSGNPFTLPGEIQPKPESPVARGGGRPSQDKVKKMFIFFVLLAVFLVIIVLLLHSLVTYRSQQAEAAAAAAEPAPAKTE